jgi:tripartite-type tricarboxylate transporter receptor subunit TctC
MESKKFKMLVVGVMVIILSCITLWSGKADGQERKYPNKPIEVIVTYPPGGPVDIGTRILVNDLSKELGVPISIQYKPGAGGMIGASYVATSKPDGYTLVSNTYSSLISAPFLEKETTAYDPLKDFTPIVAYGVGANVLANHSSSNITSFDALVKFAKEKPGELTCSTPGAGTTAHFILEVLKMYGVNIIPVPTKGGGPSATSVLGKHTDLGVFLYSAGIPHVKSGALRLLAATNKIGQEPGIPTLKEKGFPECEVLGAWLSLLGPANLPKPIQDHLASATRKVIQMPSVKKALEDAGYTVGYKGPDELNKIFPEEYKTIEKIVKAAGVGKYAK